MKNGADDHAEGEDESAGDPFLIAGARTQLVVFDFEGLDLFSLAAVVRAEARVRFAQARSFGPDLLEFRSQARGFAFGLRQAKCRRRFCFQITRWDPTDLALGRLDPGPTLTRAEHLQLVPGLDSVDDLELGARARPEVESDISANPTDIGGRRRWGGKCGPCHRAQQSQNEGQRGDVAR